jgi:ribonuclease-3
MGGPSLDDLGARLGISLRTPEAIRQAFVHSSYFNENQDRVAGHNERLEFLGDAVIGLVVSRLLYERYPDEDEGLLTARRAALVNRDSLASLALRLGLDRYVLLGRGEAENGGATRPSLLAGTFEAVVGAVYLAEGVRTVRTWLRRLFADELRGGEEDRAPKSAKSRLQEWSQRVHHQKPRYELTGTRGPAHDQTFTVSVQLDGRDVATGTGTSRQRAEEQAAAAALEEIHAGAGEHAS